jgi:hypothetical protein
MKGLRLCDATNIIKNVEIVSENIFQNWFQHLFSRWQMCIVAQGDYFEGNVA